MKILGIARQIDRLNEGLGQGLLWLSLALVVVQFVIVILRYVFGLTFVWLTESLLYMFACLFMLSAGYTLLHNGHVRIDIFFEKLSARRRAWVNIFGTLFFLMPACALIVWAGLPYVGASWAVWEGSRETDGIHALYLLKSVMLVFALLVSLQGLSLILHGLLLLTGHEMPAEEKTRAF